MQTDYSQKKFNTGTFKVFDAKTMPYKKDNASAHFALTDALIAYAGAHTQPILHFWQTPPLAILGMMDTKISCFQKALSVFEKSAYEVVIRNSGGLAIVSDPGILNISLIYPSPKHHLSIDSGYELMLSFIRKTFYPNFPQAIKAYEITNSYCFGDYDLSIEGKKIAGISQRRIKDGVAVMLYLSITGDQEKRAQLLKDFYAIGLDGSEPAGRYPDIRSHVMTTLEKAYNTKLNVHEVKTKMLSHFDWEPGEYNKEIDCSYAEALKKMLRRNRRVFGEDFV